MVGGGEKPGEGVGGEDRGGGKILIRTGLRGRRKGIAARRYGIDQVR